MLTRSLSCRQSHPLHGLYIRIFTSSTTSANPQAAHLLAMSLLEPLPLPVSLPQHDHEVIDVDALEDDSHGSPTFVGFHGPVHNVASRTYADMLAEDGLIYTGSRTASSARRSHPTSGAQAGPSSRAPVNTSSVIILDDSDNEDALSYLPRTSRRNRSESFLSLYCIPQYN